MDANPTILMPDVSIQNKKTNCVMKTSFLRLMNFQNWTITIALMVVLTACLDKTEAPEQTPIGFVNLYNAAPYGTSLDVYLNDTKVNPNAPFDYSKNSGYLNFPVGSTTLKFNKYNTTTELLESTFEVVENKAKSLFVINEGEQVNTLILEDVSELATASHARIRFVHLSPNPALKVDLHAKATDLADSILFEDRSYKSNSSFLPLKSRTYTFILFDKANGSKLDSLTQEIGAGRYYTIIAKGYDPTIIPNGNNNKITLQLLNN